MSGPRRTLSVELPAAVGRALAARGWRVAVAESCTGGLVAGRLTDVPGSSQWVLGGVVAYADRVKVEQLGVPEEVIRERGAVSEAVARAMAEGVRRRFHADVGVGVTGIAGPGGAVPGKPVGTTWLSVATSSGTRSERADLPGGRHAVREGAAEWALRSVLAVLGEEGPGAAPTRANPETGRG